MNILILGSGIVGANLAKKLSEQGKNVFLLDDDINELKNLAERFDIKTIYDDPLNPSFYKNFESKIIHIPGHTNGHICFYFEKEKIAFTGDTLFSLGCGRIFEGSYEEMFFSLNKLKKLPKETKIYCGHEYTLKNSEFCLRNDKNNLELKNKILEIKKKINSQVPTVPSTIGDELACNIFLRADTIEKFSKLRDLKDNF